MRVFAWVLCLWIGSASAVMPIDSQLDALSTTVPNDWQIQLQRLQRLMLEQEQLLQALQAEVREVRGENELLRHNIDELTQRQRDVSTDFDRRLSHLESSGTSTNTANAADTTTNNNTDAELLALSPDANSSDPNSNAATTKNPQTNQAETPAPPAETEQPETVVPPTELPTELLSDPATSTAMPTVTENSQPATEIPTTTENPQPATPAENTISEQELYQNAFDLLQAGKFDRAVEGFTSLLQTYPNGEYADNAQYWIGESQYAKYDYNAALRSFNAVLENYPNSNKRAAALLKIGYAYDALKNTAKARQVLEYVRDKFIGTATARLAEERLQHLR